MYDELVQKVAHNNTWGCSVKEYTYIVNMLEEKGPCNLLVFGLGRDTELWYTVNKGGKTVFLENLDTWIEKNRSMGIDARKVDYDTKRSEWETIMDNPERLTMKLDDDILNTKWDLIFVDSPMGGNDTCPGRMQSIYTASTLDCNQYILHDVDRHVERVYGAQYLGTPVISFDRLTHYTQE